MQAFFGASFENGTNFACFRCACLPPSKKGIEGGESRRLRAAGLRRLERSRTLRDTGDGVFMTSGKIVSRRSRFRPETL
ncbi:hypothetical protein [Luteimonas salinilitoris]|uniref:hypothetical protein n=1 Tax=Luteimonas salinilitoris TaxID=3237697 RepID=UPI00351C58F5